MRRRITIITDVRPAKVSDLVLESGEINAHLRVWTFKNGYIYDCLLAELTGITPELARKGAEAGRIWVEVETKRVVEGVG